MKESFEKIKERLRAKKDNLAHNLQLFKDKKMRDMVSVCETKLDAYIDALSIVYEVEAEYGNGWIPCNERLPEKCGAYLVSYKNTNCIPCATVFDGVQFLDKHVIAWMPLPEPWKGEMDAKEE